MQQKLEKNKSTHLYFLENARAYQIIKYLFKLNGENHVSAECIFYYTVVKLANDYVIVLFACQKCFNYRAGGTSCAGGGGFCTHSIWQVHSPYSNQKGGGGRFRTIF